MPQLPSLTPLRGIAALLVLLFHTSTGVNDPTMPQLVDRGHLGVDLFFVLSGFVLTHVYLRSFLAKPFWPAVGAFLWARFARIYPVHLFVIIVSLSYIHRSVQWSPEVIIANLLLLHVPWFPGQEINGPSWSLSAEWNAYLLFPFVIVWLWRCDRWLAVAIAAALMILPLPVHDLRTTEGWPALARSLPEFALGALTYRLYATAPFARLWRSDWAFLAVIGWLLAAFDLRLDETLIVWSFPALLLVSVGNSGWATRLLNSRPLAWLGDISYSLYMGQALVIATALPFSHTEFGHALGLPGIRAVTITLVFVLAVLMYRCVEVPARRFLRGLPERLSALRQAEGKTGLPAGHE